MRVVSTVAFQILPIGSGEIIIFLVLLIIGVIVIILLKAVIHFILPIVAAVVVWYFMHSLIYAGVAFLVVALIQMLVRRGR
jgi:hypothetical protein